jgi:phage I-like protein
MPWHIEDDNPGCLGYAVVKDEDGELEGCHRTRAQAEDQLAALNIAEYDDDEEDDEDDDDDDMDDEDRALAEIDDLVDHADKMTNRALVEQILARVRRPR